MRNHEKGIGSMHRGLITAIRTLTMLPIPGEDATRMSSALPWFPIVGLLLGGAFYGIAILPGLLRVTVWSEGIAVIVVILSIFLTRAMHLDGLADSADGFGCRGDRVKILAVMKDPHIGAFGVIALITAILVKFVAIAKLVASGLPIVILAATVVSRTMQAELATVLPYARQEGGTAAPFVNGTTWLHRLTALGAGLLILCGICGPVTGLIVFAIGWVICRLFGWWCKRKIGGVTGDLLGACSEIVEIALLFGAALFGNLLGPFLGWQFVCG
jgi:adenosylcobinamide-GDP ribazoletransferase